MNLKETEAKRLFLMKLAKETEEKEVRAILRETADKLRRLVHGWSPAEIRTKINELLEEYYTLEFADLMELSGIPAKQLTPVLDSMETELKIEDVRRRRWQEVGKHYNRMFRLLR